MLLLLAAKKFDPFPKKYSMCKVKLQDMFLKHSLS